jgi:hypothetical protein
MWLPAFTAGAALYRSKRLYYGSEGVTPLEAPCFHRVPFPCRVRRVRLSSAATPKPSVPTMPRIINMTLTTAAHQPPPLVSFSVPLKVRRCRIFLYFGSPGRQLMLLKVLNVRSVSG